jgi:shikimate kinase
MIIVLLGYMASGKSTIGEILAVNLGYNFVDLDHYIEEREASSIAKLFANRGEIYFRKKESLYLNEMMITLCCL